MNPALVLWHRADFDGVCSAAIVKKFVPDCELYGIDYGDPFPWDKVMDGPQVSAAELEAGSGLPRRQVFMVDFSLPPGEMKRLAEVSDLVWIDHHRSAIEAVTVAGIHGLREVGRAGCELCWEWFTDSWPVKDPPEAVRLLGRYDVWDAENPDWPRIEAFQFGMRAQGDYVMDPTHPFWGAVVSPDLWRREDTEKRVEWGLMILSYRDQEAKSLCADGVHVEHLFPPGGPFKGQWVNQQSVEGWRLICLNSLQRGSWQFNSVWDPEKHDAMCVYGRLKNGKYRVSLYSTKEEVDCGAIAKALGGGGHKGAAGFICDKLPWE